MSETGISAYRMNPAEDHVVFGDELEEGMWVLCDDLGARRPHGGSEDDRLRAQRFRKVTRLRRETGIPEIIVFIGEWVDGYQLVHRYAVTFGWIVKKDASREAA